MFSSVMIDDRTTSRSQFSIFQKPQTTWHQFMLDGNKTAEYQLDSEIDDDMDLLDMRHVIYTHPVKNVPLLEATVKIFFYLVLISVAFVGNTLVIGTVIRCKRMHTATNYYLTNLAVADLAVTLSCSWVHLVDDLTEGWVLGAFFCKFNSFVQVLSLISSVLTLTLIACDRFFGIVFSLKARITDRRSWIFILFVWLISGGVSTPLLSCRTQYTRFWSNFTEVWCADNWPRHEEFDPASNGTILVKWAETVYYTTVSTALYFIPMTVISAAYSAIAYKLWFHRPPGEVVLRAYNNGHRLTVRKRAIQMLLVILTVFAVCWLPLQISLLYAIFRADQHLQVPDWYDKFKFFSTFLAHSNSAFNPIIYTFFNESFRRGFKDTCRGFRGRKSRRRTFKERSFNSTCKNTLELRVEPF